MSTPEEEEEYRKIDRQWKETRAMSFGQLMSIKDRNRRDFQQTLAEIALELYTYDEKVRADRRRSGWAIVISILSLAVAAMALFKPFGEFGRAAAIDHSVEDAPYSEGP